MDCERDKIRLVVSRPEKLPDKKWVVIVALNGQRDYLENVDSIKCIAIPERIEFSSNDVKTRFLCDVEIHSLKNLHIVATICFKNGKSSKYTIHLADKEEPTTRFVSMSGKKALGKKSTNSRGVKLPPQKRFKVALSFPGERRDFVEQVAKFLVREFGKEKVFYDKNFQAELARPDLDTYLQNIYHNDSYLIVVFLCSEYEKKEWCGLEWRAIRDLIKARKTSDIMPIRFDNTHISGLFSIDGYIDASEQSAEEVAACITERYRKNRNTATN